MLANRSDDLADKTFFRGDRLFSVNAVWYFATREGIDQGPFATRQLAERALAEFVDDTVCWEEVCRKTIEVRELDPADADSWAHFEALGL